MPFYSPTTLGFYDVTTNVTWPDDAIEISAELYEELMVGQAAGKRIVIDDQGLPSLTDAVANDDDKRAAAKSLARKLLAKTDYTQTADVTTELTNVAAFADYRAQLRAIFRDPPTDPDWPRAPDPIWA